MKTIHQRALQALRDRGQWEDKQRLYYRMRHEGVRRVAPPFQGAADMHYPLIDGAVDRMKPMYWGQLFASRRLADFVGMTQALRPVQESAADFFDYVVKEETQFASELMSACDTMLVRQRGVLKVFWDGIKQEIVCESVDPLFIIMPASAVDFDDADFFVHVKQMSLGEYIRDRRYTLNDEETLRKIKGVRRVDMETDLQRQEKVEREGITWTTDEDTVLIWELWEKTAGGWTIYEYSPNAPELALRPPRGCASKYKGKPVQPFVSLVCELKDKGWYSPRGISERLAMFEAAMTKQWNSKMDFLEYVKPMFVNDGSGSVPNNYAVRFRFGEVLPRGVTIAQTHQVPFAFDQEMTSERMIAEQYIQLPEAGLAPDPARGSKQGERVTAKQVGFHEQLVTAATNMRGWIFRLGLAEVYWRIWALILQYRAQETAYFIADDLQVLPAQALSDQYRIKPAGALNAWNREADKQAAYARLEVFRGDPLIDQDRLTQDALGADDARLVHRLFLPSGQRQKDEYEDEAIEIGALLERGFPASARPNEMHEVRIKCLLDRLQMLGATGAPVDPVARQRMHEHLAVHLQFLQQQNPAAAKQIMQMLQPQPQNNVVPMPAQEAAV